MQYCSLWVGYFCLCKHCYHTIGGHLFGETDVWGKIMLKLFGVVRLLFIWWVIWNCEGFLSYKEVQLFVWLELSMSIVDIVDQGMPKGF